MGRLEDAINLISMLEQLTEGLSKDKSSTVAWSGIQLTLAQIRSLIAEANLEPQVNSGKLANNKPSDSDSEVIRGTTGLASRIQKAPTSSGRVRDLLGPVSERVNPNPPGGRGASVQHSSLDASSDF